MKEFISAIAIAAWIFGLVLAKGFWSTLIALTIFPWSWYLVAEYLIKRFS